MPCVDDLFYVQAGMVLSRYRLPTPVTDPKSDSDNVYFSLSLRAFEDPHQLEQLSSWQEKSYFSPFSPKFLTQKGDIVIRLRSPVRALMIRESEEGIVVPSVMAILRCKSESEALIHPQFFVYYFNSYNVSGRLDHAARGSSKISMITRKHIAQLSLASLPTLQKQEEFLAILNKVQEEISLHKELLSLAEQKEKAILQHIFPATQGD